MAKVYALKLEDELSELTYQQLIAKTGTEKRARIQKFFRREDSLRCLFADLLIRHILIQDYSLPPEEIHFQYSEYGKPFAVGQEHIHFNLSHSGAWVVCAVDNSPVGIDIEAIKPADLNIADAYFSTEEKTQLFSLAKEKQIPFFYELWTLKESYIKMIGKGLSIPLDSFTVLINKQADVALMHKAKIVSSVFLRQYSIDGHYKMAICSSTPSTENIVLLSVQKIAGTFGVAV